MRYTRAVPLPIWIVVAIAACAADPGAKIPRSPPRTLSVIAESPQPSRRAANGRDIVGYPETAAPIRRGPCGIPLSVSPEGLMTRSGIEAVQQRLVANGLLGRGAYRPGELDAATLAAIRALQRREGLPDVGLPTYATVRVLGLEAERVFLVGDATCTAPEERMQRGPT